MSNQSKLFASTSRVAMFATMPKGGNGNAKFSKYSPHIGKKQQAKASATSRPIPCAS